MLCIETGTAGTFEIPSRNLLSLPASDARARSDAALVMVASSPVNPNGRFVADGLDAGVAVGFAAAGKHVIVE